MNPLIRDDPEKEEFLKDWTTVLEVAPLVLNLPDQFIFSLPSGWRCVLQYWQKRLKAAKNISANTQSLEDAARNIFSVLQLFQKTLNSFSSRIENLGNTVTT